MHIVLLNQAFYPDVVATAQMARDLADHLVARGHRVSVVASRSVYGKSGAQLPKRETIDGIEIHRVGASIFGKSSIVLRVLDFGFFYLMAFVRTLTLSKPDVVVGFTTPPFIAFTGIVSRWLRRSRAVYWVMDLYPDLPVACGVMKPRSPITRVCESVNRFILRRCDATVVLGRCMENRVMGKGVAEDRVVRIPVWADTDGIVPVDHADNPFRAQFGLTSEDFCVMYSGNFGLGHDHETICRAMARLKADPPKATDGAEINTRFVFIGGGKRRVLVEQYIADNDLGLCARYLDYLPREQIHESLGAADVHLISLKEGVEGIMVPSKLLGILAAARASVFVGSPESEIARVLDESGSGVTVREGDDEALADQIRDLATDRERCIAMGVAGRAELLGKYDRTTACDAWASLLESLVQELKPSAPTQLSAKQSKAS